MGTLRKLSATTTPAIASIRGILRPPLVEKGIGGPLARTADSPAITAVGAVFTPLPCAKTAAKNLRAKRRPPPCVARLQQFDPTQVISGAGLRETTQPDFQGNSGGMLSREG